MRKRHVLVDIDDAGNSSVLLVAVIPRYDKDRRLWYDSG